MDDPCPSKRRDAAQNLVLFFRDAVTSVRQEGLELSHIQLRLPLYRRRDVNNNPLGGKNRENDC